MSNLATLLPRDLDSAQSLEFIKNRTNNNINWESLSQTAEHIAQSNNLDSNDVALNLINTYSTGDNALFNIDLKEDKPIINNTPPKDLSQYESGVTSTQGLKNLGLDVIDTLGLTQFNEAASERKRDIQLSLNQKARDKIPYEQLDEQEYWVLGGLKNSDVSKFEYEKLIKDQEIAQKSIDELSQEDKEHINLTKGISALFSEYSGKEDYEEFVDKVSSTEVGADLQAKLQFLNNIHEHKSLKDIFLGSDDTRKYEYLSAVETLAQSAGFKGIAYDNKGDVYFYDDENVYKPNQNFFGNFINIIGANTGTIGGAIAGATAGFKKAKTPQQAIIGAVAGSALGASIGASSDVILTNAWLGRKNNAREIIQHSLQEGALSIVGDLAFLGGAQAIKQGVKLFKNSHIPNALNKIVEYTPIIGFVSRFSDGNAKAAIRLVNNTLSEAEQKSLNEFSKSFGGNINFEALSTSKAYENIKAKFGENHFITKGAKTLNDAFMLKDQLSTQQKILQAIRADSSGNLIAFLSEAANSSPILQNRLKSILSTTTQKLKEKLEFLNLNQQEIKEIFTNFEKGTKQEYVQAIEDILGSVYDENYKAIIDKSAYKNFRAELENSGVLQEDSMRFLSFVESNIYNEKGVTFKQLNNALKNINSYYKQTLDPNFRDFVKNAVENFIRDDIKNGVDSILSQNTTLYKDAQALFGSALSDYGKMKATLKMVDKLKIRDESLSYEKAFNNLYKFLLGQGGDISNLNKLTQHLEPKAAARVEINILGSLFNQHLKDYTDMQVFDSSAFLDKLKDLLPHFKSQAAKDFVEITQGFNKLFKNDVLIADSIRNATTEKIGSSIATSIEGAVRFQVVKIAFENIVRLLPHIPFLIGINEKIQGAALRFHIKSALYKNLDVQDFKIDFTKNLQKQSLNSETKQVINRILGEVDNAQDRMIKESSKESARANNAKDLQEYNTLKAYDVESLELLNDQQYKSYIDSVLSGDMQALQTAPNIVYIANLDNELAGALGLENVKIFLRKNDLHHFRGERKAQYNQDVPREVIEQLPQIISSAKNAYIDTNNKNFFITHDLNDTEAVKVVINKDTQGNYIITASRVARDTIDNNKHLEAVGLAPTIPAPASKDYQTTILLPSTSKRVDSTTNTLNMQGAQQEATKSILREELAQNLKTIIGKDIINKNDGRVASVSKKNIKKMGSDKAIQKSLNNGFSIEEHFSAAKNIDTLYENAHFKQTTTDLKGDNPNMLIHRYEAPINDNTSALLTLKESLDKDNSTRIYTLELEKLAKREATEWGDNHLATSTTTTATSPNSNGIVMQEKRDLAFTPAQNGKQAEQAGSQINAPTPYDDVANSNTKLDKADSTTNIFKTQDTLYNANPLSELGENYPQYYHKPQQAITHLLEVRSGQVAGAFHKENLGDIDLVWGDSTFGLEHILTRRTQDFIQEGFSKEEATQKAEEFVKSIPQIIENGKLDIKDTRAFIKDENSQAVIAFNYKGDDSKKWLLTAYKLDDDALNTAYSHQTKHNTNTSSETRASGDIKTNSSENTINLQDLFKLNSQDLSDFTFLDTKGKKHTLKKETQEQWLKTFELENLEQSYIPKHSQEIKEALGNKEIRLQKGSLLKLVSQGREDYIPQVKAVLDEPEAILYDIDGGFLFIKHLKDEDYFVNVSYDKGEYLVSISNGIKETNNLQNKLEKGAKILYQSPNFRSSRNKLLQTSQSSVNKIDKTDSTQNLFKQQDINFENLEDFTRYANLSGIKFADEKEAKQAFKYVQSNLNKLEC